MEQLQKFRTLRDLNFRITLADLSFNNRPSNSQRIICKRTSLFDRVVGEFVYSLGMIIIEVFDLG